MRPSWRLLIVLSLVAILSVNLVDLFAKPWRQKRSNDLLRRAQQAVCYEQPDTAQRLLTAAETVDAELTAARRSQISSDLQRVVADHDYARQYYDRCGNADRVAVLDAVDAIYDSPKAALDKALELANQGETAYAKQLVSLATTMNPDYAGIEVVRNAIQ